MAGILILRCPIIYGLATLCITGSTGPTEYTIVLVLKNLMCLSMTPLICGDLEKCEDVFSLPSEFVHFGVYTSSVDRFTRMFFGRGKQTEFKTAQTKIV